jgi:hypothetical protein
MGSLLSSTYKSKLRIEWDNSFMAKVRHEQRWFLVSFMLETWNEFMRMDKKLVGFRDSRWSSVQKMRPGDKLLAYVTGISRFIGILRVESPPHFDQSRLWKEDVFPCRVEVSVIQALSAEEAVPISEIRTALPLFAKLKDPRHWSGPFRSPPVRWAPDNARIVEKYIAAAKRNPTVRPVLESDVSARLRAYREVYSED